MSHKSPCLPRAFPHVSTPPFFLIKHSWKLAQWFVWTTSSFTLLSFLTPCCTLRIFARRSVPDVNKCCMLQVRTLHLLGQCAYGDAKAEHAFLPIPVQKCQRCSSGWTSSHHPLHPLGLCDSCLGEKRNTIWTHTRAHHLRHATGPPKMCQHALTIVLHVRD